MALVEGAGLSDRRRWFFATLEEFAMQYGGGAEIELALLFADVGGSTALGEQMTPLAFSQLINRFYNAATDVLVSSDALIDKFVGDEVIALYLPGFAGPEYTRRAIEAAHDLLKATGYMSRGRPGSRWGPACRQGRRLWARWGVRAA